MELSEIRSKLSTIGIPVAYLKFNKPQKLPFMVYYESGAEVRGADNYNLIRDVTITVELYTAVKDVALEREIEALFRDREIERSVDTYLKDENMFMAVFSFNTIQPIEEE